ncbi:MAG: hypothetical protein AB2A00_01315 [Myxococcota bacterium]
MKRMLKLVLVPAWVACQPVPSAEVDLAELSADIRAVSNGVATRAEVVLRQGDLDSPRYVELTNDDAMLVAAAEAQPRRMSPQLEGPRAWYSSEHNQTTLGSQFVFSLTRKDKSGAPRSTCTLPDVFDLLAPAADVVVRRGSEPIAVSWRPAGTSGNQVLVTAEGECFVPYAKWLETDSGSWVISSGSLTGSATQNARSCDATITVSRRTAGELDPAFGKGGRIHAAQERQVRIRVEP